jgi:plastocyanin
LDLDKDIFVISVFCLVIGISAQLVWYFLAKAPCPAPGEMPQALGAPCSASSTVASLQEIQNVSGLIMLFGFILLPIGLFKDGLPIPGPGGKVFLGVLLVLILGLGATYALTIPVSAHMAPAVPCGTPQKGSTVYVCMGPGSSLTFSPKNITIVIGTNATIQWSNDGDTTHTTTSLPGDPQSWNSGDLNPGQTFTVSFSTAGTYHYYCTIHGLIMSGYIIVEPKI